MRHFSLPVYLFLIAQVWSWGHPQVIGDGRNSASKIITTAQNSFLTKGNRSNSNINIISSERTNKSLISLYSQVLAPNATQKDLVTEDTTTVLDRNSINSTTAEQTEEDDENEYTENSVTPVPTPETIEDETRNTSTSNVRVEQSSEVPNPENAEGSLVSVDPTATSTENDTRSETTTEQYHLFNQVSKIISNTFRRNISGIIDQSLGIATPPGVRNFVNDIFGAIFCTPARKTAGRC